MSSDVLQLLVRRELLDYRRHRKLLISSAAGWLFCLAVMIGVLLWGYAVDMERSKSVESHEGSSPGRAGRVCVEGGDIVKAIIPPLLIFSAGASITGLAATSLSGEKEGRTLEPLFLLPVRDVELVAGKGGPLVVIAALSAWAAYLVACGISSAVLQGGVVLAMRSRLMLVVILLAVPAAALFFSLFAIVISALFSDVTVVRGVTNLAFMVFALALFTVSYVTLRMTAFWYLVVAAALGAGSVGLLLLLKLFFRRERILLRY